MPKRRSKRRKTEAKEDARSVVENDVVPVEEQPPEAAPQDELPAAIAGPSEPISPFSKLSGHIVLKIFWFLDVKTLCRCALVCKDWRTFSRDHSLWEGFALKVTADFHDWEVFRRLSAPHAFSCMLRSGYLHTSEVYFHTDVRMLIPGFIQALSQLPPDIIIPLERLTFHDSEKFVNDETFRVLSPHCSKLTYLYASECSTVSDHGLAELLSHCGNLHEAFLSGSLPESIKATLFSIGKFCAQLTKLTIQTSDFDGLVLVLRNCSALKTLYMDVDSPMDMTALSVLGKHATGLSELGMSLSDVALTDADLVRIAAVFPMLTKIGLFNTPNVSSAGLEVLLSRCTRLEDVQLDLPYVNATTAVCIAEQPWASKMHTLKLAASTNPRGLVLTAQSVALMATRCTHLRVVSLRYCVGISDLDLIALASMLHLEELDLDGCGWVTDVGLSGIAPYGADMSVLSLNKCISISDVGLLQLMGACPQLWELRISDCPGLSDNLLSFFEKFPENRLEFVQFSRSQFSDAALREAATWKDNVSLFKYKFAAFLED